MWRMGKGLLLLVRLDHLRRLVWIALYSCTILSVQSDVCMARYRLWGTLVRFLRAREPLVSGSRPWFSLRESYASQPPLRLQSLLVVPPRIFSYRGLPHLFKAIASHR